MDLRSSESTRNANITLILHNEASIVGCTFPSDIRLPYVHWYAARNSRSTSRTLVQKGSDIPTTLLLHVPASTGSDTLKYINDLSVVALRRMIGHARDRLKDQKFEWSGRSAFFSHTKKGKMRIGQSIPYQGGILAAERFSPWSHDYASKLTEFEFAPYFRL